ncbi:MAG: hypothetical protein R3B94_08365 [Hyphomonas sp.]
MGGLPTKAYFYYPCEMPTYRFGDRYAKDSLAARGGEAGGFPYILVEGYPGQGLNEVEFERLFERATKDGKRGERQSCALIHQRALEFRV